MNWSYPPGTPHLIWAGLFGLLYVAYLFRVGRLATRLGTPRRYLLVKLVLRSAAFVLLLIALLGPAIGRTRQEIKALGKDIYLCVDLSTSMLSFDLPPSRLEKVKYELKNLIRTLEGDRIGLIVFSDDAFLLCPLTFDQGALQLFIETLNPRLISGGGTDLAAPILLALQKLARPEEGEPSLPTPESQNARAIVLLSDGEDHPGRYRGPVSVAASEGIPIYCLGVGTRQGGAIPAGNQLLLDGRGRQVVTRLEPERLSEIASRTGGRYYELTDRVNGFAALARDLRALQGQVIEVKKLDVAANRYAYVLGVALLLLFLDVLIPLRVLRLKEARPRYTSTPAA